MRKIGAIVSPSRLYLANEPSHSFGEKLRSLRLKKKLTQKNVAHMIGVYISKRGTTLISDYEKDRKIPSLDLLPRLSHALGIDPDVLFKMVLKEHYNRFIHKHQRAFHIYINGRSNGVDEKILLKKMNRNTRYYFYTRGKIEHKFPLFKALIKNKMKEQNKSHLDILKYGRCAGILYGYYLYQNIVDSLEGNRIPTVRLIVLLSNFFNLNSFELYKGVVNEKVIGHIENAKKQWEIIKNKNILNFNRQEVSNATSI